MESSLFLEPWARALLVIHALGAMALLGAVTHQGILAVGYLSGYTARHRLEATYVRIVAWLYPAVFALGALAYPTYRVRIRAAVFDLSAPWASNAFDIKENLAALGLFTALALALSRPRLSISGPRGPLLRHAALGLSLAILTWAQVVLGLVVTAEEGL